MSNMPGWSSGGSESECCEGMSPFFLPVPMAIFGVIVAFMFGVLIGSAASRRRAIMSGGWSGGMHDKHSKHGIRGHHHHGYGAPACREWHDDWPAKTMDSDAEPGGTDE